MNILERFTSKIGSPIGPGHVGRSGEATPCLPWVAFVGPRGYGQFRSGGRAFLAHRFAYELWVGPIPDGLVLDHLCRVRHCVNHDHLEPVTQKENTLRGIGFVAVNAVKEVCPKCGEDFTPYTDPSGYTRRKCLPCKREGNREWHRKQRQKNLP